MKTFFIAATSLAPVRTLVMGDFGRLIKEHDDARFVVFVPADKVEFVRQKIGGEQCIVEAVSEDEHPVKKMFRLATKESIPTRTVRLYQGYARANGGTLVGLFAKRLCWYAGHFRLVRSLLRAIEFYAFRDDYWWQPFFDRYRPAAVLSLEANRGPDSLLIKRARRLGIPSVGLVNGWDNLSGKGMLRAHPDVFLCQSECVAKDAAELNDMPHARIRVVGFPHFDHYEDPAWRMSKEEVARGIGADPVKRWIGYFAAGGALTNIVLRMEDSLAHINMLSDALAQGKIENAELIVSVYPSLRIPLEKLPPNARVALFDENFYKESGGIRRLMNLIRFCDVTVSLASTVALEASIFDRPIVTAAFNGDHDENLPWQRRLSVMFDEVTHFQTLLRTGGTIRTRNRNELIEAVRAYLKNPESHREGRKKIKEEIAGPVGNSYESIFQALFDASERKFSDTSSKT